MPVLMHLCMYEKQEITWPGEGPTPMQLRVAHRAALSSDTARREVDRIEGRFGASACRHAQLL
eukprot:3655473-Pyramimonas_sp.AAC.1